MGPRSFRIIGRGRAGSSLADALVEHGWTEGAPRGRGDDLADAALDVDLVVIATPDGAVADTARSIGPQAATVVIHLAGSLGLDVLEPHGRRGALHPLVSLPSAAIGARRLADHAWFATAGDPLVGTIVADLGGRSFPVADSDRAAYHAAAAVASNHVVVLLAQVERLAALVGVPLEAFLALTRATVDNVSDLGARAALTGPAARGDWATIDRHLNALDHVDATDERELYRALALAAARLAGQVPPPES